MFQVVGPLANNIVELFGNYHSDIVPSYCSTPLDGLKKISNNVQYASGCDNDVCNNYNSGAVTQAVKGAEIIFLCLGAGKATCSSRVMYNMFVKITCPIAVVDLYTPYIIIKLII